MSEKRNAYVEKLKANIDEWNVEIDKFKDKADQAKADAQVQCRKHVEELKAKRHELEVKIAELQKAKETAWEDVKAGVDTAWHAMGESIKAAKSRFN